MEEGVKVVTTGAGNPAKYMSMWKEAKIKVINPTPMIQSMLYWANVSVHCNDQYQVIFPPDVQFGADHHKVYFTNWPIGEANLAAEKCQFILVEKLTGTPVLFLPGVVKCLPRGL